MRQLLVCIIFISILVLAQAGYRSGAGKDRCLLDDLLPFGNLV
jgi:hypothetical protein